jgi:hypothetical protein
MAALQAQTQSAINPFVLLAAPIFGLLGTALGWWLNQLTERRRRELQLADDDRRWKREDSANQDRWIRDRRKESYASFIRAANEIHQQALLVVANWAAGTQMTDEQLSIFSNLMHALEVESAAVQLFGGVEVTRIAREIVVGVWAEAKTYKDEDTFKEKREEVDRLLQQFITEAKVSLEVEARQSE